MTIDIADLHRRLTAHQTSTESALDFAVGLYKEAACYIDALEEFQAECKLLIADIFAELGTTEATTSAGRCYVTRPGVTISYDRKGLDELCERSPELRALLEPYRKVSERAGTLTVR